MNLNPKIAAALLVSVLTAAANIVAILADAYPDNETVKLVAVVVSSLLPVIAGYAKSQGDWQPKGES
jgi:hypothetical protein